MAVQTGPAPLARPGASERPSGRGRPQTVTLRVQTALAPILTGIALAQETIESASLIQTAAASGSRALILNEAGRLGHKATRALTELRTFAGMVEK